MGGKYFVKLRRGEARGGTPRKRHDCRGTGGSTHYWGDRGRPTVLRRLEEGGAGRGFVKEEVGEDRIHIKD